MTMKTSQTTTQTTPLPLFDTYKIIGNLTTQGASTKLAESIVDAIQQSRTVDLSTLVSKADFYDYRGEFYDFKEHNETKLNRIEKDILIIRQELSATKKDVAILDNKIENTKTELKKDIATLDNKIEDTKTELKRDIATLDNKIDIVKQELSKDIETTKQELSKDIKTTKSDLSKDIETTKQELRQEIELKTSQLETKIEKSKNTIVMWMIGLISAVGLMLLRLIFMNG